MVYGTFCVELRTCIHIPKTAVSLLESCWRKSLNYHSCTTVHARYDILQLICYVKSYIQAIFMFKHKLAIFISKIPYLTLVFFVTFSHVGFRIFKKQIRICVRNRWGGLTSDG